MYLQYKMDRFFYIEIILDDSKRLPWVSGKIPLTRVKKRLTRVKKQLT